MPPVLRADFSQGSHRGNSKAPPDPRWIVTLDHAIGKTGLGYKPPEDHCTYSTALCGVTNFHNVNHSTDPLEFVSPTEKLTFGPNSQWRKDVETHWEKLLQIVEVVINDGCATHVHVCPRNEERWSLEQLKPIAKAIIYFDPGLMEIYAPSRREHMLTQSNKRENHKLKDLNYAECFKRIDNCTTKDQLFVLMQREFQANPPTRDYAWNFENTLEGRKGSIGASQDSQPPSERNANAFPEFRCAPGATNVKHCLIWVELGISFVHAATKSDTTQVLEKGIFKANAHGLEEFILRAARDDMNDKKSLAIVFHKNKYREGWLEDDEMWAAFDKML